MKHLILSLFLVCSSLSFSAASSSSSSSSSSKTDFDTNCCRVKNPPSWLKKYEFNLVAKEMETSLHWLIRKIDVIFYNSAADFAREFNMGFTATAFFRAKTQSIHVSPPKDLPTFTKTFRHELVHVIFNQKYKSNVFVDNNPIRAIPEWLEEGLANLLGSERKVDYAWLKKQNVPPATSIKHPNSDASGSQMHYQLSTATAEMISVKCKLRELLMLSTGRKMETYIANTCKIPNVDDAVRDWIKTH